MGIKTWLGLSGSIILILTMSSGLIAQWSQLKELRPRVKALEIMQQKHEVEEARSGERFLLMQSDIAEMKSKINSIYDILAG